MEKENEWVVKILLGMFAVLGIVVAAAGFGLLLAFPVKWCWNYVMAGVFGLPIIGWGHAWCLIFLSNMLLKPGNTNTK